MWYYETFQVIVEVTPLIFTFLYFLEPRWKKHRILKRLYPENWYSYIKIYFFSDLKINDIGCSQVNIEPKRVDLSNTLDYQIPLKLCLPPHEKLHASITKLMINFETQQNPQLELLDGMGSLLNNLEITGEDIKRGYQGKLFLHIFAKCTGIEINININTELFGKSNKKSKRGKVCILINGITEDNFQVKID